MDCSSWDYGSVPGALSFRNTKRKLYFLKEYKRFSGKIHFVYYDSASYSIMEKSFLKTYLKISGLYAKYIYMYVSVYI